MRKIKLIVATFLLAVTTHIQAQTEKTPLQKVPDYIQNADYIFEGTAIEVTGYWTTAREWE
jgi:hypothetical protein